MANNNNGSDRGLAGIRAVILDYGEVLCCPPQAEALSRMASVFGIEAGHFLEVYEPSRVPYDQGRLTAEKYWRNFARRAGVQADPALIRELRSWDLEMWSHIRGEMAGWLAKLDRAGLTTAVLSNMPFDMAAHARRNFRWLRHAHHQLLSCELGLVKPDAAIFQRSIERIGVRPEEALLVDDRQTNIDAALAVGITAIRFESTEQLRRELRERRFEILPEGLEGGE